MKREEENRNQRYGENIGKGKKERGEIYQKMSTSFLKPNLKQGKYRKENKKQRMMSRNKREKKGHVAAKRSRSHARTHIHARVNGV